MSRSLILTSAILLICPITALADADLEKGKAIFEGIGGCGACHGALGKGDGAAAAALDPKPNNFTAGVFKYDTDGDGKTGTEADLFNVVTNGAAKYSGSLMMVGRADIPEADRRALVKYVLSFHK